MANLEDLLNNLANLEAQHDLDGLRGVREKIVSEHPESDEAVEALYKIGLDFLFRERKLELAIESFREATRRKHPFWSAAARTSLGLCYYHRKQLQLALFELRKVAYADEHSSHSLTALTFIENILREENKMEEVERVQKDRNIQLHGLIAGAREGENEAELGFYLYQLGVCLIDSAETAEAKTHLAEAKALGPDRLGADLYRSVIDSLSRT
jgi:tetratricopeptide (TPR) repeat protein